MKYNILPAQGNPVPILISVPHCGTAFPLEVCDEYYPDLMKAPDDTDWYVDKLYDFAPAMGITIITAHYSRWVIDLNRDPKSKPLYNDGRIITGVCPVTDFLGNPLYKDHRQQVNPGEIARRIDQYFNPYYIQIESMLDSLTQQFGKVLLWDCHSIRQFVPTIQTGKFPDLILGDVDGTAASPGLIESAMGQLEQSDFIISHNHPFKGGQITRHFGKPGINRHALQLEMCKIHYMDDSEKIYDQHRADKMRLVLERVFEKLIGQLT